MSRVLLGDIPRLTFYDGSMTRSRRGKAIPQLTCRGKSCDHYRPDVIRCTSMGGSGADVDWKCEAELPESLRLGRVEVSCEGWSGPGDSYVFKESCGLEYRLVDVPRGLRDDKYDPSSHRRQSSLSGYLFFAVFFGVLIFILYNFFSSCFRGSGSSRGPPRNPPGSGPRPYSSRSGPRRFDDTTNDPPPPYSATDKSQSSSSRAARQNESPFGFWTGAALGGIGTYLATRNQNNQRDYDWERRRAGYQPGFFDRPSGFAARPARSMWDDDRGEGSSSGATRRSTGFGGSNVR